MICKNGDHGPEVKDIADNQCFPLYLYPYIPKGRRNNGDEIRCNGKALKRSNETKGHAGPQLSTTKYKLTLKECRGYWAMVVSSQYLELFQGYCQGESISRDKAELQLPLPLDLLHPDPCFSFSPMPHIPPLENSVNHVIPAAREVVVSIFHKM